jgi:hypothetical protein
MGRLLGVGITTALMLWPVAASASEVVWTLQKKNGRAFFFGMLNESEVDYEFWALCRADGAIDVGAAAESHVGKGGGEAVTLKLASGLKTATLTGVSHESENVEMTGGVELRATVSRDHPVFAVLTAGNKIKVTGPLKHKSLAWETKGLKPKLAAFLKACK